MSFILNSEYMGLMNSNAIERQRINLDNSTAKISSGKRISRAGDDAASLSISTNINSKNRSLMQAKQNAEMALGFMQTSEGYLQTVQNNLTRMNELSVQAATDTLNKNDRSYVNVEFKKILEDNAHIVDTAKFGSIKILDGSAGSLDFQIGANNSAFDRIHIETDIYAVDPCKIDVSREYKVDEKSNSIVEEARIDGVSTKEEAQRIIPRIKDAIEYVSEIRANLGAAQNRISSSITNLQIEIENNSESSSRMEDTDIAAESVEKTKNNILLQTSTAMMAHSNDSLRSAIRLFN